MHFSAQILEEYRRHADRRVAFVCRWMIVFMLGVLMLNDLGIFKVQRGPLLLVTAVSVVNFALPTLFDRLWGGSPAQRYLILTILVVQSGLQYAVLSYHTILMLAFPLVLSCLYNEKQKSRTTNQTRAFVRQPITCHLLEPSSIEACHHLSLRLYLFVFQNFLIFFFFLLF